MANLYVSHDRGFVAPCVDDNGEDRYADVPPHTVFQLGTIAVSKQDGGFLVNIKRATHLDIKEKDTAEDKEWKKFLVKEGVDHNAIGYRGKVGDDTPVETGGGEANIDSAGALAAAVEAIKARKEAAKAK